MKDLGYLVAGRAPLLAFCLVMVWVGGCRSMPSPEALSEAYPTARQGAAPVIRPGIRINVAVEVEQAIQTRVENVRIASDGSAPLPLIGEVSLEGLSLRQAEQRLSMAYAEYYVNPTVHIDFAPETGDATSPWGYVTVLGQVRNPGRVNLPPTQDLTVTRAIQLAGGLDRSARDRAVRITRWTDDGVQETMRVNLRKVGAGGTHGEDVLLKNADVVFVPETLF